jgi:hypothetical protein
MNGPPNVEPSALWSALQVMPRPFKVVDFPRRHPDTDEPIGQLVMWPLTQNEQMACTGEADRFAKKMLREAQRKDETNLGYETIYSNEVAVQVLYRACRDVNDHSKPAFPLPVELRDKLSADEVGALFALYCSVQVELGPIVTRMSKEEMEAWVKALVEGGQYDPFPLLSLETQHHLLNFMASQLVSFWTRTSSAGSLPGDLPEESEALSA